MDANGIAVPALVGGDRESWPSPNEEVPKAKKGKKDKTAKVDQASEDAALSKKKGV